jgi:hypothetical protein
LERTASGVVRVRDRDGCVHAELAWTGETAVVTVALAPDSTDALAVESAEPDALFGRAHPIVRVTDATRSAVAGGLPGRGVRERLTTCSPIDWRAPRRIPAIAAPGTLPPGAGSALLDLIAVLAADAGVAALRYAGPYPTEALWRALAQCFRTTGDRAAFTSGAVDRALGLSRDEIPIDFTPAPFERAWIRGGEVHLRDGVVERARIAGTLYATGGSPGRLVPDARGYAAEVWFGDEPWARVAVLDAEGRVTDGPHPVPPCTSAVIGSRFPRALRGALADLIADLVAPPLAEPARSVLADEDVTWADCGAAAARAGANGLEVHAALWERISPLGMARLGAALAEALAPIVALRAQARLAAAVAHY